MAKTSKKSGTIRARRTITMDPGLEKRLRDIQGQMIMASNKNWSLSAILNVVVLAGIMGGSSSLNKDEWKVIKSFLKGEKPNLSRFNISGYVKNLT